MIGKILLKLSLPTWSVIVSLKLFGFSMLVPHPSQGMWLMLTFV